MIIFKFLHSISLIAIGNGTGCRDCEIIVSKLIQNGKLLNGKYRFVEVNMIISIFLDI